MSHLLDAVGKASRRHAIRIRLSGQPIQSAGTRDARRASQGRHQNRTFHSNVLGRGAQRDLELESAHCARAGNAADRRPEGTPVEDEPRRVSPRTIQPRSNPVGDASLRSPARTQVAWRIRALRSVPKDRSHQSRVSAQHPKRVLVARDVESQWLKMQLVVSHRGRHPLSAPA